MTRRQNIRIFTYVTIVILTVALCAILWPSGSPSVASAAAERAQDSLWQEIAPGSFDALRSAQQSEPLPQRYKAFQLNEAALANILADAPLEFTEAAKDSPKEITLPMPDGRFARFRFVESPIMAPELAAKFPEIKTYQGWGLDDPTATTRFDRTSDGFHAKVLSSRDGFYIARLSRGDTRTYGSYFTGDTGGDGGAACVVEPGTRATARPDGGAILKPAPPPTERFGPLSANAVGTTLRDLRLAVAMTAEYTNSLGSRSPIAEITTVIDDINLIYQRELAVRFTLVADNEEIIFTDANSDGYTSGNVNLLPEENQTRLDQLIGANNYDIGHVFDSTGLNEGKAVGLACIDGEKGKGASVRLNHAPFYKAVAHEIGHQLGAQHTMNNNCQGNINVDTAFEPECGATIMSYGTSRIPYFHSTSLVLMADYLNTCGCGGTTNNNNNTTPHVSVLMPPGTPRTGLGYYQIPAQTPFALTASASDAEDTNLTFSWDELDRGSPGPSGVDRVHNPLFRSFDPTESPSRTFPQMSTVLGGSPNNETLPTTERYLQFRVTARDNHSPGGGFDQADVVLAVRTFAGPFVVTEPAAGTQTLEGQPLTVRWNVASTNLHPMSATDVRILLSTDNGEDNFPTTLVASTPNDGLFTFIVPHINAPRARIKVEAINNIFFNVSPEFTMIPKPIITATGSVTVTRGGPSVTAQVATVADQRDPVQLLAVTSRTALPAGLTLRLTRDNGMISAEATAQCNVFPNTRPIRLEVTNSAGLSAWTTFNLVVDPNPPPTLGTYDDQTVIASQAITVTPSAPPSDPNSNLDSITASFIVPPPLPGDGSFFVNQTTGVVTIFTRNTTRIVTHQIRVEARDTCGLTVTRTFFLRVLNSPPQVTSNGYSVLTTEGSSTSLAPVIIAIVSDQQDAPGALLLTSTAPQGLTVSLTNSGGTIRATATATCAVAPDTYTVTLTVTDSSLATASTTFPVIVEPNLPPTLGMYLDTGVTVGGSVLIAPNAPPSDPNNAVTLTVNPLFLPGGGQVMITQPNGQVNGRVTVNTVAQTTLKTYQVLVTARDTCGLQVTRSFKLTVRSATCITEHGAIFVADTGNHRIQRFNGVNWNIIGPGTQGSGLGQFTFPESVVASPDGRKIYVADWGNRRIQWSQDSGGTWSVFASNLMPQGLVLDRDGNLYVSDAQDNRVVRYIGGLPGNFIVLATGGSGAGQVSNPNGMAIDCRMNLYIADTGNDRILVIATADAAVIPNTATVVASGPGAGLNPAQVTAPQGVTVDNAGKLYVADTGNERVLMVASAPTPGPATVICTTGPALGQVRRPEGVTIARFTAGPLAGVSSLIVSDTTNNRIQGSGLPSGTWMLIPPPAGGGPGTGMGQFKLPSKIR